MNKKYDCAVSESKILDSVVVEKSKDARLWMYTAGRKGSNYVTNNQQKRQPNQFQQFMTGSTNRWQIDPQSHFNTVIV